MLLLFAAPGLLRLELRLDGRALVPADDPALAADERMRDTFLLEDQVAVFVETFHPRGILNRETLDRVRRLTVEIYRYPEIERRHIMSLGSEGRDRVASLSYSPFLYPLPETEEEMASLEADIRAAPILLGTLVAPDFSGTVLLVQVPRGMDRGELYARILETVDAVGSGDDRIHVVGSPVAEVLLGNHLLEDLGRLLPICILLLSGGLLWAFRRPAPVALVMAEIGACLVWTFGLMGRLDQPIFLTTAVLPVVLATLGLTDEVHLLVAAQRRFRRRPELDGEGLARAVMADMHRPIFLTSITTAVGFLSFQASDLPPVRAFGLWAAVGVLFCLGWSLCVTPVLLRLLGPERLTAGGSGPRLEGLTARLEELTARPAVRWGAVAFLGLVALGAYRIEVQDGWISGFSPGSPFRQSVERVNRSIHGTHLLQLHLSFEPSGLADEDGEPIPPFRDPRVIEAVGLLEEELRKEPVVGGVLGPYSRLATTNFLASGRIEGTRRPPDNPFRLRQMWRRLELGQGPHRRREIVTDDMDQGLVTVFLKDANYRDTARVEERVRELESSLLAPLGGSLDFAGDVAVSQSMISSIVRGQLRSIALALVGILVILWAALGRFRTAIAATVPVTVACASALGLMGWGNVPLGVATSMFIAITLGVGVDFPVHVAASIERRRLQGSADPVAEGRAEVVPAILIDTAVAGIGFGLLVLSQVPANARLGGLVALSVGVSCACTLLFLRPRRP